MSVLNENTIIGASGAVASSGYTIDNSLRCNNDDSAYLSRTPASAGNRKTWTWSGWVKRGNLGVNTPLFATSPSTTYPFTYFRFNTLDGILLREANGGTTNVNVNTGAVFRDPSAWYHVCVVFDTTEAATADRYVVYVNAILQATSGTLTLPINSDGSINSTLDHAIAAQGAVGTGWSATTLDGYLAEVNFIDGLALTPDSFGEFGTYGEWKPKAYTGSYGTNGFIQEFKDSGDLGKDTSGNANDWTPTNLAATDQMLDSPTNNFATLNSLIRKYTGGGADSEKLSEGNLKLHALASNGVSASVWCSTALTNGGKWYWEGVTENATGIRWMGVGDDLAKAGQGTYGAVARSFGVFYKSSGVKSIDEAETAYGDSYTTGDVIGVALDMDNSNIYFSKNGVWQNSGVPTSGAAGNGKANIVGLEASVVPSLMADPNGTVVVANFGQDSSFAGNKTAQLNSDSNGIGDFYYTPPAGFLALCTQNLPEPAVIPSEHFNTVLYTGNGAASRAVTGVGFATDTTWIKERSNTSSHLIQDTLRGPTKLIEPDQTSAESTTTTKIVSFDYDGFTVGASGAVNQSGETYAAWNWKANGAGVSNTDGSITSTVSANVDAGFSIIEYSGNSTIGATTGHGLTIPPEIVFTKATNVVAAWNVNAPDVLGDGYYLFLHDTSASAFHNAAWTTNSTNLVLGSGGGHNQTSRDYIAYAFHSVDGYSKVGSYTGNGSADGPFVHCGFRPAYVMVKRTDSANDWVVTDNARDPYNVTDKFMKANSSVAEISFTLFDITANGIKLRTASTGWNANGGTYIYLAFAESPFKHSNAR
jgi:hypothetical protein